MNDPDSPGVPPYLIICGCPRSGTTITTRVLCSHERLVLGIERYKQLARHERISDIGPECFTPDRFFDFKPEETNIRPEKGPQWREYYERLRQRSGRGDLVWGDKFPNYFRFYRQLADQLDGVRFVFLLREFDPVASSFQVRADNPEDNWYHTAEDAVEIWNEALRTTIEYVNTSGHAPLFVCNYEALFDGVPGHASRLLKFIGLERTGEFMRRYRAARVRYEALCRERTPSLSDDRRRELLSRADLKVAEELRVGSPEHL